VQFHVSERGVGADREKAGQTPITTKAGVNEGSASFT
jgi:hypothetical protein